MDYKTFNDWSTQGYKIIKGSKATWIDGVAMFSPQQVVKRPPRRIYRNSWNSEEYADPDDPFEEMARDAAWGLD